jgi:hypothetical protein
MKAVVSVLLLLFVSGASFAQTQKTIVFCRISSAGQVNYGNLEKLLPDSIKTSLLVDPRKEFKFRNADNVILWMSLNDWKLICTEANVNGMPGYPVTASANYLMSKEIVLDEVARAACLKGLETLEKK